MSNADERYSAQIVLLVGDAGVGKTFFAMNHPLRKQGFFLDLEHRYTQTLKHHPEIDMLELTEHGGVLGFYKNTWEGDVMKYELIAKKTPKAVIPNVYANCLVYDKNFDVDRVATFNYLKSCVDWIIATPDIKLIVIDGIEDVRRMAMEKYEEESSKTAYGFQAWGVINDMVKRLLYRIFNYARINDIRVVLTTHFTRVYNDDGTPSKDVEINCKDYITDRVDEILAFKRSGTEFLYKRGKSPKGPSDLEGWTMGEGDE